MLALRPVTAGDLAAISAWPPYEGDMAQMDYSLRGGGWLPQYQGNPDVRSFAVEHAGELIGFTLLIRTAPGEDEIRIALRPDMTGQGLGGAVMGLTLERGFADPSCRLIHLIVRLNNHRGINLYRRLGFVARGELCKTVNGSEVDFLVMDLHRDGAERINDR